MLARKGVSLKVMREIMGHEDIKTTQIYSHLQSQNLIEVITKL
jgi:site-specific recombinase XerD